MTKNILISSVCKTLSLNKYDCIEYKVIKKKILVTGGSGYIGARLLPAISENDIVVTSYKSKVDGYKSITIDLSALEGLELIFKTVRPDFLIHLAALTNPAKNDEQPLLARRLNFDLTVELTTLCKKYGVTLIYLSTDKVFDGSSIYPAETDVVSPVCLYGQLKADSETVIQEALEKYFIFRLPIVHSMANHDKRNFLDSCLLRMINGEKLNIFKNIRRSYIQIEQLVDLLVEALNSNKYGIYHAGTKNNYSYFDRLKWIAERCGVESLDLISPVDGVAKPINQGLNSEKVRAEFKVDFI